MGKDGLWKVEEKEVDTGKKGIKTKKPKQLKNWEKTDGNLVESGKSLWKGMRNM